jgi:hypothetical protein
MSSDVQILPDYLRGDTLSPITFLTSFTDDEGNPLSAPGPVISARLQFRSRAGVLIGEYSSAGPVPTLIITDATDWSFVTVAKILTTTFVGSVVSDLEVTYQHPNHGATVLTTSRALMNILADVTQ